MASLKQKGGFENFIRVTEGSRMQQGWSWDRNF